MRTPITIIIAAALGGVVGAALYGLSGFGSAPPHPPAAEAVDLREFGHRLESLEWRVEELEAALREAAEANAGKRDEEEEVAAGSGEEGRPATLAEVREYLAEKLEEEDRRDTGSRFQIAVGDAGDMELEKAAKAVGIAPGEVDRIEELFRAEGEKQLKAVFGTEDLFAVRERIRRAEEDPGAWKKLQEDLLANLMRSLPAIQRAEKEKWAAIRDLLGKDRYEKYRALPVREGESDEFDALLEKIFGKADAGEEEPR